MSDTFICKSDFVEPGRLYHLSSPGEFSVELAAVETAAGDSTAAGGHPAAVSGLPAHYYWKDAIAVGTYQQPARGLSLQITRDRLDGFARNFAKMKAAGIGVPVLMDHSPTAAATLGWIVDVKRDGDRLLELHQFLGDDARDIGLRNKVSLGIDPAFVDSTGTAYGEAIVHSAVTPVPVVPGQGDFVAASLTDDRDDLLLLSRSDDGISKAGAIKTASEDLPVREQGTEDRARIDPETGEKPAADAAAGEERSPKGAGSAKGGSAAFTTPVVIDTAGVSSVEAAAAQREMAEMALSAVRQTVAARRDMALARGGVDPATAQALLALLDANGGSPPGTINLSRATQNATLVAAVFELLEANKPVPLGECTGLQVLSRVVPGEEDRCLQDRMIALASGKA